MPLPTAGDVHVDAALTNILVAFTQEPGNFIANKVSPFVPVAKRSDEFFKYDRGDWNRAEARKRAPGTESAGGGWRVTTDVYFCDVWGIHKDVDDQTRSNSDAAINLDRDATRWDGQQILIRMDKEWTSTFFTTGVWTGSTTGGDITPGTLWDAAGSDPIKDIDDQLVAVMQKTGRKPNKLTFSMDTWIAVKNNASVLDRIKHTQTGIVTEEIFAALVGVEEVLILKSVENTAAEGATDSMAFIGGGKAALLSFTTDGPGLLVPTAMYTFVWTGLTGSQNGMRVKNFRMEELDSDRIEAEAAFDFKVVASDLAVFFTAVIS